MNAVLWWLGENTLAVALLIPVALLLCRVFRTRPAVQHALWLVLLLKFLMPPIVESPWPVESLIALWQPAPVDAGPSPPLPDAEALLELIDIEPIAVAAPIEIAAPPQPIVALSDVALAVTILWCVGCVLAFLVQVRRLARHRTLIRAGTAAPRHLDDAIGRVSLHMGLRPIRAVVVGRIASPFVWCFGWLRLVWPEALLGESDVSRSRGMIAHELAHIRRRDHWVAWLEFVAGLVWWWNPVFWFVRRRLRESAELACDAVAIGALPDERAAYAEMFLELSTSFKSGTPVPVLGMSTGAPSSFERRLTMILCERVSGKMSWRGILLAGLLAALAAPTWSLGQSGGGAPPPQLSDFEKRLLDELRQKELAFKINEVLENTFLDTISEPPKEAWLLTKFKKPYIRLQEKPGFDTFRIYANEDDAKPILIGKVLRIDERAIHFQVGKDVHTMTFHQSLAEATRNKLDAKQLEALGLPMSVDAQLHNYRIDLAKAQLDRLLKERDNAKLGDTAAMHDLVKLITVVVDPGHWYYVQQQASSQQGKDAQAQKPSDDETRQLENLRAAIERLKGQKVGAEAAKTYLADIEESLKQLQRALAVKAAERDRHIAEQKRDYEAQLKKAHAALEKWPQGNSDLAAQKDMVAAAKLLQDQALSQRVQKKLIDLRVEMRSLLTTHGTEHSKVVSKRHEIEALEAELKKLGDHKTASASSDSLLLLRQGRMLFLQGRLDEAEKVAKKAEEIDRRYGLFEDSPKKLRDDVARQRSSSGASPPPGNASLTKRLFDIENVLKSDYDGTFRLQEKEKTNLIREQRELLAAIEAQAHEAALAKTLEAAAKGKLSDERAKKAQAADLRVVRLTNVQAGEIAKVLVELFGKEAGNGLTIVAESRTNSLLVRGTAEQQEAVEAIVRRLETLRGEPPAVPPGADKGAAPGKPPAPVGWE